MGDSEPRIVLQKVDDVQSEAYEIQPRPGSLLPAVCSKLLERELMLSGLSRAASQQMGDSFRYLGSRPNCYPMDLLDGVAHACARITTQQFSTVKPNRYIALTRQECKRIQDLGRLSPKVLVPPGVLAMSGTFLEATNLAWRFFDVLEESLRSAG